MRRRPRSGSAWTLPTWRFPPEVAPCIPGVPGTVRIPTGPASLAARSSPTASPRNADSTRPKSATFTAATSGRRTMRWMRAFSRSCGRERATARRICRMPAGLERGSRRLSGRSLRAARIDAHQLVSRVVQVIGDNGHRRLDIARTNRLVERRMLPIVFRDPHRRQNLVLHGVPLTVCAHGIDLTIDPHHERIAGRFGNQLMKFLVPQREALAVSARRLHAPDCAGQPLDVAAGGVEHGEVHHLRLDPKTDLDELERTRQFGDTLAVAAAGKVDEGARAESPRHEPLRFEPAQGGADRGARCAQGRGQLALGRKLLAVRVPPVQNRLAQLRGDTQGPGYLI